MGDKGNFLDLNFNFSNSLEKRKSYNADERFEMPKNKDCSLIKDTKQKYAFIKKSSIFAQSLRNFVKIRYSWVPYFDKVS